MKVDIIIPTYKPDETFCLLLRKLRGQTFPVHRVILLNTEEAYWREAVRRYPIEEALRRLPCPYMLTHIPKEAFDHGGTRMQAALESQADVMVFMTQDAVPADARLLERLLQPFGSMEQWKAVPECGMRRAGETSSAPGDSPYEVAVAYARQLPRKDCSVTERCVRQYNYPNGERAKTKEDLGELGIKTFFCSDVCAAYRRDIFMALGGFESPEIFNEDMIFAAKAIEGGYAVWYAAGARVVHSHNYTAGQQFKRNFDLAVSQQDHPRIFKRVSSGAEGKKMVLAIVKYLCRTGRLRLLPGFVWQCAGKYAGYCAGRNYRKLTRKQILRFTMSPDYWRKLWGSDKEG